MDVRRVRLSIDSNLGEVRRVRRAISALIGAAPLNAEEWYQVKVCIAEAVNNAIIHAYGRKRGHRVKVEVEVQADRVVCRISDSGKPMPEGSLRQTPRLDYCPKDVEALPEGGMGLYIIHQVMDRVEYSSQEGRNVLTLTKLARSQGEEGLPRDDG